MRATRPFSYHLMVLPLLLAAFLLSSAGKTLCLSAEGRLVIGPDNALVECVSDQCGPETEESLQPEVACAEGCVDFLIANLLTNRPEQQDDAIQSSYSQTLFCLLPYQIDVVRSDRPLHRWSQAPPLMRQQSRLLQSVILLI